MRNYVKPEFYVEQFMPNEYISACVWVEDTVLNLGCPGGGSKVDVTISGESGGNYNLDGGGTLWMNQNFAQDGIEYGISVSIPGHTETSNGYSVINGEYKSVHGSSVPDYVELGDIYQGYVMCNCNFTSEPANANAHHHVKIYSQSQSKNRS